MNSRMMISSVFGRVMSSFFSRTLGIMNRISVSTQRKTFSKLPLKICASMTNTTEMRSRIYTIVTERLSCQTVFHSSSFG